eukprot:4371420-Pleurochrysis_carterae.AAC.1
MATIGARKATEKAAAEEAAQARKLEAADRRTPAEVEHAREEYHKMVSSATKIYTKSFIRAHGRMPLSKAECSAELNEAYARRKELPALCPDLYSQPKE